MSMKQVVSSFTLIQLSVQPLRRERHPRTADRKTPFESLNFRNWWGFKPFHSSMALQPFVRPWPLLQFRNLFYADGRTPWISDQPVARPRVKLLGMGEFLTSVLDGGEWSVSRTGRFTPGIEPRFVACPDLKLMSVPGTIITHRVP
jgi:hypothetical protein